MPSRDSPDWLGRWLPLTGAPEALAIALTGMMNDDEITREEAAGLTRMVLRENAIELYKLKAQQASDPLIKPVLKQASGSSRA